MSKKRRKRSLKRIIKTKRIFILGIIIAIAASLTYLYIIQPLATPPTSTFTIGILDQFYSESPEFTNEIVKLAEENGLAIQIFKDEEVNVELYRKLPTFGFKLIILRVHTGISEEGNYPFLFTSENYSDMKYPFEQVTNQIGRGIIPYRNDTPLFTVGPDFFRLSAEGDFNGAVVILSSCYGLYNDFLAEAFIEKGAKVFISWSDKVGLSHTDAAVKVLVEALVKDRMSIIEALRLTAEKVGSDPTYGGKLRFYPVEEENFRLDL